jgi:hypothetical protein
MATPQQDRLSSEELAEQYGYASAILNSNAELRRLFQQAVAGQWSPDRFAAKLRSTNWFRNNSERWRQTEALRLTDPKTFRAQLGQIHDSMRTIATEMGASINTANLGKLADQAYRFGWDENQMRRALGQYISVSKGVARGQAAENLQNLRATAYANGVRYSDAWYQDAVRAIGTGTRTVDDYAMDIRKVAASAFPVFREQIMAGANVADVASPYVQSMGQLLELNPQDIDLFDPTIRSALSGARDPKTGEATSKSLWQFENDLRKDPRWAQTNNAREQTMSTVKQVLDSFGFQG